MVNPERVRPYSRTAETDRCVSITISTYLANLDQVIVDQQRTPIDRNQPSASTVASNG